MKITDYAVSRRAILLAAGLGIVGLGMTAAAPAALADEPSGDLVLLNWASGSELALVKDLEAGFTAKYPKVTFKNSDLTVQGDQRGAIRTALLGGEKADLLINTWPAFRKELAAANMFGDRSALFYRPDTLKKAGIEAPAATWDEFKAGFAKLNGVGVIPIAVPAKVWAHTEWFETLLLRTAGIETAAKLARHEIPWTDPAVKTALKKYAELLQAQCCGEPTLMLATDWDNAAERVLKSSTAGFELIGMWVNTVAKTDYGLKEGTDYSIFQFPALGAGHDDTSSVDSKEFVSLASGSNPAAADAFLGWLGTAEAANIVAKHGLASPSNKVDASLYGPVTRIAVDAVSKSKVQFVLGDLLPGDLVDEYRVQLQKFLQDPSDANIDAVTAALEAKAAESY